MLKKGQQGLVNVVKRAASLANGEKRQQGLGNVERTARFGKC